MKNKTKSRKPIATDHEVECPHCGKTQVVNAGTGIYECTECDGEIEITLECPECDEELEIEEWGKDQCPVCQAKFDSWKQAVVTPLEEDEEDHEVECPHCTEGFFVNDGTGIYNCPHCEEQIEVTLSCPSCDQEVEVEEWGEDACPSCGETFDSWKEANVARVHDVSEEDESTVSCEKCGYVFEEYQEAGQIIKAQIPWNALKHFGPVALNTVIFGPLGGLLVANWEAVMDIPHAWKAYRGSELDAVNAGRFPCPQCEEYSGWVESD